MQWTDNGLILSVRKHGENSVIIHAFTCGKGRCAGLVRGGVSRRLRGILQPGNEVDLTWRSRLADQLGSFTVEARKSRASKLFDTPGALAGGSSALALLDIVLPEREAHATLYKATLLLFDALADAPDIWPLLLARWELGLLGEIGYGLDLSSCAATGATSGYFVEKFISEHHPGVHLSARGRMMTVLKRRYAPELKEKSRENDPT